MTSLASGQNLVVRFGKSGITPIIELVKAIFKKRPDNQRNLIFLQVSLSLFHCLCSFSHLIWYQTFLDFDLHCLLVHLWTRIHDVWIFVNQISWIWWTIFFKFDYIQQYCQYDCLTDFHSNSRCKIPWFLDIDCWTFIDMYWTCDKIFRPKYLAHLYRASEYLVNTDAH